MTLVQLFFCFQTLNFFIFTDLSPINNVVVSREHKGTQPYVCMYPLSPPFSSSPGCHNIEQSSMCYRRPCWYFFTLLESGKPRCYASRFGIWWRPSSLLTVFILCLHVADGLRELSRVCFIRALILFMGALPLWPSHLPRASPPHAISLGIRISTWTRWRAGACKLSVYSNLFLDH